MANVSGSTGAPEDVAAAVVGGNRRAAGRLISAIENGAPGVEAILRALYPRGGHAYIIGFTGPPGAGKSTLVDEMIRVLRELNLRVGVLAVDPNSPFSGGAILGDRIRMMRHASDDGVFIRSMGARGHLGGLALAAGQVALVFDAMGMDIVLLETVGVGQSELEVAGAADTAVVVIPPGMGDGVQAIKAGIMEIADIFVVNKADHANADKTVADIRDLLRMDIAPGPWVPRIVKTIATQNDGLAELWNRIEQHRRFLQESGGLEERRRQRIEREIMELAERRVRERVLQPQAASDQFHHLLEQVMSRRLDPFSVADQMMSMERVSAG